MPLSYTNTYYFLCNKFKGQKIVKGETNIMLNLLTYNTSKWLFRESTYMILNSDYKRLHGKEQIPKTYLIDSKVSNECLLNTDLKYFC